MGPRFTLALALTVISISSAAMIFLDKPAKSSFKRLELLHPIEIKWGEGSEAGTPDSESTR